MIRSYSTPDEEYSSRCPREGRGYINFGMGLGPMVFADDNLLALDKCLIFRALDLPRPKRISITYESVLKDAAKCSEFVAVEREVRNGKPCIKGTRVPVYAVLNAISQYGSLEGAAKAYGVLSVEQVRGAVDFSACVLESPVEHEFTSLD